MASVIGRTKIRVKAWRITLAGVTMLTAALGALVLFALFFYPRCSDNVPFMAKGTAADCRAHK